MNPLHTEPCSHSGLHIGSAQIRLNVRVEPLPHLERRVAAPEREPHARAQPGRAQHGEDGGSERLVGQYRGTVGSIRRLHASIPPRMLIVSNPSRSSSTAALIERTPA